MVICDCFRCTATSHLMEALDRRIEEVINNNDPITMNESNVKRKNNFREFVRNK